MLCYAACPALPHHISSNLVVGPEAKPPKCNKDMWCGLFHFFSCSSYNIIKNPLNFNVPYKICALVKASTDNYFWWINQEDKYVWSSCYSIQFLLYTSPAGAIAVMFQLGVEGQFLETLRGRCEPWTFQCVLRAHCSGRERTHCSGSHMLNCWKQGRRKKQCRGRKALSLCFSDSR